MELYEEVCETVPIDPFTSYSLGETFYFLKSLSASANSKNFSGWTPLMYACSGAHYEAVKYLLEIGARTDVKDSVGNRTPLMLAIGTGHLETIAAVCTTDDLELTDHRGWTALFYAVYFGREVCIEYLLNQGAQINKRDHSGRTPALLAVKSGIESLIAIFMKRGADFGVISHEMESAVTLAAGSKSPQIRKMVSKSMAISPIFRSPFSFKTQPPLTYSPIKVSHLNNKENEPDNILFSSKTPKNEKQVVYSLKILSPLSLNNRKIHPTVKKIRATNIITPPKITVENRNVPLPPAPVEEIDNVLAFLQQLKLEKYWPIFRDEEVDFVTLLTFDDTNLQELGIKLYGPRKKILAAIQEYRSKNYNCHGILQGFL